MIGYDCFLKNRGGGAGKPQRLNDIYIYNFGVGLLAKTLASARNSLPREAAKSAGGPNCALLVQKAFGPVSSTYYALREIQFSSRSFDALILRIDVDDITMFDTIRNEYHHFRSRSNAHSVEVGLLPRDIEVQDTIRVSEASEDGQTNHKPPRLRPSYCLVRWRPQQLPLTQIRITDPHFFNKIGEHRSLNGLCSNCAKNFSTSKLIRGSRLPFIWAAERFLLHESINDLYTAVQSGCHFCNLAWQEMDLDEGSIPLNSRPSKISVRIIRFDQDTVVFELSYNDRVSGLHHFWGTQRIGDWFLYTHGYPCKAPHDPCKSRHIVVDQR